VLYLHKAAIINKLISYYQLLKSKPTSMLERTIRLCVSKINITGDIFRISKTVFLFIAVLLSPFILEANVSICEFYDNCEY